MKTDRNDEEINNWVKFIENDYTEECNVESLAENSSHESDDSDTDD